MGGGGERSDGDGCEWEKDGFKASMCVWSGGGGREGITYLIKSFKDHHFNKQFIFNAMLCDESTTGISSGSIDIMAKKKR